MTVEIELQEYYKKPVDDRFKDTTATILESLKSDEDEVKPLVLVQIKTATN